MTPPATREEKAGSPRSPSAAERLARFERQAAVPIVLASVLPIMLSATKHRGIVAAVVYVGSWIVFVVDFVVHEPLTVRYLHARRGRFDLVVVVFTAPWIFIPGLVGSRFLVLSS